MTVMSQEEVSSALDGLDGWTVAGDQINKQFEFADFRQAIAFVVRAAFAAEDANHHPDLDVRYNKVTVALSTHSEGGVTQKDIDLAQDLDEVHR